MNNGLDGRYLDQLEAWNNARMFASDLLDAYHDSSRSVKEAVRNWNVSMIEIPTLSEIKQMVSDVLFLNGRSKVDDIARAVMKWDGWYNVEPPTDLKNLPEVQNRRAVLSA